MPDRAKRVTGRKSIPPGAKRAAGPAPRGTTAERGYGYAWQKASAAFLRLNPLCVVCLAEGRAVPSAVTDHVTPHKGDAVLFWDRSNWQALCVTHHNRKSARE